jgi:hypothetical protein
LKRPLDPRAVALLGLAILAIPGCGSSKTKTVTRAVTVTKTATAPAPTSEKTIGQLCPPGASYMGCATGVAPRATTAPLGRVGVTAPVPGCKVVDVSGYQGHPNWKGAAAYVCAAVAKSGEGGHGEDPDFAWNIDTLRSLHIPWASYFFVRGCGDGSQYVSELDSVHFKGDRDALRPVLDMEVPAARGCAVLMADAIHSAFGIWPIIYTAPGTWPGGASGGLDVWEADYGPSLGALPFSAHVLAWQRWSPPYTFLCIPNLYSPGCGTYGDVSIDLAGFSRALAFPPPRIPAATVAKWIRARNSSERAYAARSCVTLHQRVSWFSKALSAHPKVKTAPRTRALASSRRAYAERSCAVFAQRSRYFAAKVRAAT